MYYLNNWEIIEYLSPSGQTVMRLSGQVFGHPDYDAGCEVVTSALCSSWESDGSVSVTTQSGCEYVLGNPNPAEATAMSRVLQHLHTRDSSRAGIQTSRKGI